MKAPRLKWGPRTAFPVEDPRANLRHLEGEMVGVYDTTILPIELLEEALTLDEDPIRIRIKGQHVTHTLSRSFAEMVLQARRSPTPYANT